MFCSKCGHKLKDGDAFCSFCGAKVDGEVTPQEEKPQPQQTQQKEGSVFKCPFCGEILPFDSVVCPSCGNELRGRNVAQSLEKFSEKLEACESLSKKLDLIRNFPIPNSREDIMEFMLLASTNYYAPVNSGERRSDEISAWRTKMDQCHKKAHMLLKDPSDLQQIDSLYYGKRAYSSQSGNTSPKSSKKGLVFRILGIAFIVVSSFNFLLGIAFMSVGVAQSNAIRFDINPTVLDDSSALDSDKNFIYNSEIKESYYVSVKFSSEYDAEIGNYIEENYLYHAFGGTTNRFTATIDVYNAETNEIYKDYYSLSVSIEKGNKTYNSSLSSSDYSKKDNIVTYSYAGDIYIYSFDVSIDNDPMTDTEIALMGLGTTCMVFFVVTLPPAIIFNIVATTINRRHRQEVSNSSLGREKYLRQREEEEERREKERLERNNKK